MVALPYVLLRAPVEQRYRAHSLLDITDLQLGPIHACLLAHQLSNALALLFFAEVSRDRLLFCQLPNILRHQGLRFPRVAHNLHLGSMIALAPTLLLDGLRLHLLLPSFLPDLLQQLPPIISDSEHRAVNVIVIRKSLPFVPQVLSLLLALQQIVLD